MPDRLGKVDFVKKPDKSIAFIIDAQRDNWLPRSCLRNICEQIGVIIYVTHCFNKRITTIRWQNVPVNFSDIFSKHCTMYGEKTCKSSQEDALMKVYADWIFIRQILMRQCLTKDVDDYG